MGNALPISLEILACFILSVTLLHRYSDMVNNNIITIVGVFVSWFFSFMVIFMLPADLTSTAHRQCILDYQSAFNTSTTTPSPTDNSTTTISIISQHALFTNSTGLSTASPLFIHNDSISSIKDLPISTNITNTCSTPWSYVSDGVLTKLWRFIYWTSQLLTWLILPIMQSYSMAGDFTTLDKLKSAIRANFIYYSSFGAIFIVLLIYVMIKNGIDFANLKVIAISTSNTWGLFLLVVLLGYGLVELPRFLISRSGHSQSLSQQYFRVAKLNAEKCEAEEKLDDALEEIHQAFTILGNENNPLRQYLNQIVDKCPPDWKRRSNAFRRQAAASNSTYESGQMKTQHYDIQAMIRLHKKVIKTVHYHRQITCRWNHLIKEVVEWEDVLKNKTANLSTSPRLYKSTLPKERSIIHTLYTPRIEWYWKCVIRVWIFRILGLIFAVFSLAVVWSEIAFPISIFSPKLSIFAYFVDTFQTAQQYFYMELFSTVSIGYLAICAFYTVFHMKIYNIYYLASNSQTDEYSLLFSGMLLCRLTAPLCLNYLCLVHRDSHINKTNTTLETSFTTIMGHLDLIPIVNNGLNIFLPLCISAICSAIYFNFGTHLLHSLGFEQFIENDEMTIDWVQTGRELVKRETVKLLRNYETSTPTYHEMVASTPVYEPSGGYSSNKTSQPTNRSSLEADNSPTSLSSSSSGLSRSSLLPRTQAVSHAHNGSMENQTEDQLANRLGDNVIEIDINENSTKNSIGFFDDV